MINQEIAFEPLFARVLLQREVREQIGSIILPENSKQRYTSEVGIVVAVGESVTDRVADLLGKKVLFAKYAGDWIKINGEDFFICQDEDLLGVYKNVE
jgi:chaperonin GroES